MYQNFFSDYLVKLQETNQQWWAELEKSRAAVNSPLNKAMQEVNFEDTAKLFESAANQPATLLQIQAEWWQQQMQIWQNVALVGNSAPVVEPESGDKRFSNQEWQQDVFYNFIKQSYLLFSKTYMQTIDSIEGLDEKSKERLSFSLVRRSTHCLQVISLQPTRNC